MSENIPFKIKKKINDIRLLQVEIKNWKMKTETEVVNILKLFEKTPRDEMSLYYSPYFKDDKFAEELLQIALNYSDNEKILLNIISILGNMILRYQLEETTEIYNFILSNAYKKGLTGYVSNYLPRLKHFEYYPDKWKYFMSMQKMTPKKITHQNLVHIINQNIQSVPEEYKKEVISFLQTKHDLANNDGGKKFYLDMIKKIKN